MGCGSVGVRSPSAQSSSCWGGPGCRSRGCGQEDPGHLPSLRLPLPSRGSQMRREWPRGLAELAAASAGPGGGSSHLLCALCQEPLDLARKGRIWSLCMGEGMAFPRPQAGMQEAHAVHSLSLCASVAPPVKWVWCQVTPGVLLGVAAVMQAGMQRALPHAQRALHPGGFPLGGAPAGGPWGRWGAREGAAAWSPHDFQAALRTAMWICIKPRLKITCVH